MAQVKIKTKKRIALIAHDNRKDELLAWIKDHQDELSEHHLCGTGTTATLIKEKYKLNVDAYLSGPMGGDQQIGSAIANQEIDILIFFWDPLEAQPHDPDVRALLRIAVLYDIPVAQSVSGANYLLSSPLFNKSYTKEIISAKDNLEKRVKELKQ